MKKYVIDEKQRAALFELLNNSVPNAVLGVSINIYSMLQGLPEVPEEEPKGE